MSGIDFEVKKIRDPIHKTIGLSELEIEIINTRAFQRLRNIKQLGLVNYVFPGADYTRFSHSIGVCHLSGQFYDAIHKKKGTKQNSKEKQKYRLAGLLHDIGHYPFSHAMDEALELIYKDQKEEMTGLKIKTHSKRRSDYPETLKYTPPLKYLDHESVGREILLNDMEIKEILQRWKYNSKDIYNVFTRNFESLLPNANMISSDLDADRLDYLLRSAHHLGLPYGSTDVEYILSQIELDNENNICLNPKAIRTVDHFLLCRYFDYSQVIYHKTVAGFEEVLKKIILYFVEETQIKCSMEDVIEKIKSGEWYDFDDLYILNLIKEYYNKDDTPSQIKLMMKSILLRKPPKEIVKLEYIRDSKEKKKFQEKLNNMMDIVDDISLQFNISKDNIFLWDNGILELTKTRKTFEFSEMDTWKKKNKDKLNQAVKIFEGNEKESTPIIGREDSLMNVLADKALYSARLFILFESDKETKEHLKEIKDFVIKSMHDSDWR